LIHKRRGDYESQTTFTIQLESSTHEPAYQYDGDLFVTYGLILIVTNTIVLLLLNWIFQSYLEISSIWGAIFGAIMIGLISLFLDYIFGVIPPIGYDAAMKDLEVSA
jgi:hypothetical protein